MFVLHIYNFLQQKKPSVNGIAGMQMNILKSLHMRAFMFNNALCSKNHSSYHRKARIIMEVMNIVAVIAPEIRHCCNYCLSKISITTNEMT